MAVTKAQLAAQAKALRFEISELLRANEEASAATVAARRESEQNKLRWFAHRQVGEIKDVELRSLQIALKATRDELETAKAQSIYLHTGAAARIDELQRELNDTGDNFDAVRESVWFWRGMALIAATAAIVGLW